MRDRDNAVFDALKRAKPFLDDNNELLTAVVDLTPSRHRLDEVLASFTEHAFDQDVGDRRAKGETSKQRQLRVKLRTEQMKPIARIARANLRAVPEFVALQLPKRNVVGPAFLASARGMADAAAVHRDTLVAQGMPAQFTDNFIAAIDQLETSLSEREKSRARRVGATKGLDVKAKQGRTILSVLDALMRQALATNEPLWRAWQAARLIRRRSGTTAASAAAASAPTPLPVNDSTPAVAA